MSNTTGRESVRERERQARLQMLNDVREASPQPIFSQPVKVQQEDETSRRIKDTLGDFTQVQHVFCQDPKHLIGISRTTGAAVNARLATAESGSLGSKSSSSKGPSLTDGHAATNGLSSSGRGTPTKRPVPVNGLHKPTAGVFDVPTRRPPSSKQGTGSDHRKHHHAIPRHSRSETVKINPISSSYANNYNHNADQEKGQDIRSTGHRRTNSNSAALSNGSAGHGGNSATSGGSSSARKKPLQNGSLPNGVVKSLTDPPPESKRSQPKKVHKLNIPSEPVERKIEILQLETIIKEMKQEVPPPLTAIQTPKTEERGFHFPLDIGHIIAKEDLTFKKTDPLPCNNTPVPCSTPPKSNYLQPPPSEVKSPAAATFPFNLQEDLEMSDSDDDNNMVSVCKNAEASDKLQCKSPIVVKEEQASGSSMEKDVGSVSSSSESSDSESEDSGSEESNDSDSSASSECSSDMETPSKPAPQMWGLSNFFDETRRNHSPAFMPADTNTNSSNTGNKEEPIGSTHSSKLPIALDDEDSVNCILGKYPDHGIKDYGECSMKDLFSFDHGPIGGGKSALSPIPSPVNSPVHAPPPIIRGPRTPPSPEPSENSNPPSVSSDEKAKGEVKERLPKKKSELLKKRSTPVIAESKSTRGEQTSRVKKKAYTKSPVSCGESHSRELLHSATKDLGKSQDTGKDSTAVPSAIPSKTVHKSPASSHQKNASNKKEAPLVEVKSKDKHSAATPKSKTSKHSNSDQPDDNRSRSSSRASSGTTSSAKASEKHSSSKHRSELKHGNEKAQEPAKSFNKSLDKSSKSKPKFDKPKVSKSGSKSDSGKRSEKKKKFSIENFVQSPSTTVQSDNEQLEAHPSPCSSPKASSCESSPESSPVRTSGSSKRSRPVKERKSSVSGTSRSRSRSGSRSTVVSEKSSKRPSSRSSERGRKKPHREAPDAKTDSSITGKTTNLLTAHPPELLSPIPSAKADCAMPPIIVRILLSKLLRVPAPPGHHPPVKPSKDRPDDSTKPSAESDSRIAPPSSDSKNCNTSSSVSSKNKEAKTKKRTDSGKSKTEKCSRDKNSGKTSSSQHAAVVADSKNSSSSSDKISISGAEADKRTKPPKTSDSQPAKKRKLPDTDDSSGVKKKSKESSSKPSSLADFDMKDKVPYVSIVKLDSIPTEKTTPKPLERRDSTSSLSSLCSQQSHKSSKSSKEKSSDATKENQDSRKAKNTLIPAKDIKREKEDKPKVHIKKEPGVVNVKAEKTKSRSKEYQAAKAMGNNEVKKIPCALQDDNLKISSQINYWDGACKIDDSKLVLPANHQRLCDYTTGQDPVSEWERFVPEVQQELKGLPSHIAKVNITTPIEYYWTEGKKLKHSAEKEIDPIQQSLKYFEATVMFIMSSVHREDSNKDPDSIYQMYKETLYFTNVIRACVQKHHIHSIPGNVDYKIHVLCLKCQSLLHLKLYNLKIKEVKEQHKTVSDFMSSSSSKIGPHSSPLPGGSSHSKNLSQPSPCQPRFGGPGSVPSPHSPTPSPAGSVASVGSQSSGYSSSDIPSRTHNSLQLPLVPQHVVVSVPQPMFDTLARHHMHLSNLYMCHELWQQADMYMMRSNSKEFFKEVSEKSERLSLHSTVKELVSYLQTGLSLLKDC